MRSQEKRLLDLGGHVVGYDKPAQNGKNLLFQLPHSSNLERPLVSEVYPIWCGARRLFLPDDESFSPVLGWQVLRPLYLQCWSCSESVLSKTARRVTALRRTEIRVGVHPVTISGRESILLDWRNVMKPDSSCRRVLLFSPSLVLIALLAACGGGSSSHPVTPPAPPPASDTPFWAQWGANPGHTGAPPVAAQGLNSKLADIIYDPFVTQEQAEEGGDLVAHYQATLVDGNDFYMEAKSGTYPSCAPAEDWVNGTHCGPNGWNQLKWNVVRYTWESNKAVKIWNFASDWVPETNGDGLSGWEPVFHPALANTFLYVPGGGGTIWKVNKDTGMSVTHINPFTAAGFDAANTFVSGPLTVDANGNLYYNVLQLSDPATAEPWFGSDVLGAWLVKITPADVATTVTYATLVPGAPAGNSNSCLGRFTDSSTLPWPPTPTAVPNTRPCGSQRPAVNIAPAIADDGTVYTVSRAHFNQATSYLIAVNPDLTPKWQASLQHRLTDGCGVIVPIASDTMTPNSCRPGTTPGVDPTTNDLGSGSVPDLASSSPTVLPDGSILFGATTNYNGQRGHMFKFDAGGNFLGAFDFGWDSTPAVYAHDSTYSIIIKDNHYRTGGLYCSASSSPICAPTSDGPYYITQLAADLSVEWHFLSTNTTGGHPNGYEWCVNAPAVDSNGMVYANSEDGNLYSLPQGNTGVFSVPGQTIFLKQAIGAAYTPLSIGPDGKLYSQNDGHLFVVGN
jgi:hypothetical protein